MIFLPEGAEAQYYKIPDGAKHKNISSRKELKHTFWLPWLRASQIAHSAAGNREGADQARNGSGKKEHCNDTGAADKLAVPLAFAGPKTKLPILVNPKNYGQ